MRIGGSGSKDSSAVGFGNELIHIRVDERLTLEIESQVDQVFSYFV
jgi:hypothetical protein